MKILQENKMKDTLQKRLQEMEGENPSPSLVTVEPALRERIGFLGRYFSKAVKQVPQKTEQERLELEFARKSKRLGELIEENKIKIAESGKWFNSREDYIEIFGGGVDKKDCNLRLEFIFSTAFFIPYNKIFSLSSMLKLTFKLT